MISMIPPALECYDSTTAERRYLLGPQTVGWFTHWFKSTSLWVYRGAAVKVNVLHRVKKTTSCKVIKSDNL